VADPVQNSTFGPIEEEAVISLALDSPEFFSVVGKFLGPEIFQRAECKWIAGLLQEYIKSEDIIPPRDIMIEHALSKLTVEHDYEPVVTLLKRKSNPRELPHIKKKVLEWAQNAAYGLLYSEEALGFYERKEFVKLQQILEKAQRITDVSNAGFWMFQQPDLLFSENLTEKFTTGFQSLDAYINEGGPAKKECFVWMAPTGVGKSVLLVHSGLANVKRGKKVLHVTCEMSDIATGARYAGAISDIKIRERIQRRAEVEKQLELFKKSFEGDLVIYPFPADEISVDEVYQLIAFLRKQRGWHPDIVIIDYLELMISRHDYNNKEDYKRQKSIATEVRGLAQNENVLVFTATQTNREGMVNAKEGGEGGGGSIDLNKISESYGKAMPIDYCVSINQTQQEYNMKPLARARLYIAKNRNGAKHKTININLNYETMRVKEENGHA
jgi:archaellum biogenesis ATPase FlaH